jgi:indole-3-glycerol phosphate synthase
MLDAAYKDRDTRDFYQALKDKADAKQNAIIAEIKKVFCIGIYDEIIRF